MANSARASTTKYAMTTYNSYANLQHHDVRNAIAVIVSGNPDWGNLPTKSLLGKLKRGRREVSKTRKNLRNGSKAGDLLGAYLYCKTVNAL